MFKAYRTSREREHIEGRIMKPVCSRGMRSTRRAGVASILAMMFLVIFGSLAAVMAIVAQGNTRTAQSNVEVIRAMNAAETGLTFASRRLTSSAQRFVVEKGVVTADFGEKLWNGTWSTGDGTVTILPPDGFNEATPATSLATALLNAHAADLHNVIIDPGDELLPAIDEFGKLSVRPIRLEDADNAPYFRLSYAPLADGRFIRVTSVGYDQDLSRTITMDFQIVKRLDAAIISPNRIMIGKNVHIEGPIGSRYGENPDDLAAENGNPLVIRSDFKGLNSTLDSQIDTLIASIEQYDVDGDNRLRPGHPTEKLGLTEDYMKDVNGDGYVDDYDLWMNYYDDSHDKQICYDPAKAFSAGYGTLAQEFTGVDPQLCMMIDATDPDRNGDGVVDDKDTVLGYNDGVINNLDNYSKVSGHLLFKTTKDAWEQAQGVSYQSVINGPIHPDTEQSAVNFDVSDTKLYDMSISDFANAQNDLKDVTQGAESLNQQLTEQLGEDPNSHVWTDSPSQPDYLRPDIGIWEQMPLGSPGFYDWYKRPIYKNMTFVNPDIPMGANALFENCAFIGCVYVETYADDTSVNWNYLGMKEKVGGDYVDKYDYEHWSPVLMINGNPVYDTKPFSNNLRFDNCTFIGSIVSDPASEYAHVRNKLQFTGNTRFTLDENEIDNTNLNEQQKVAARNVFEQYYTDLSSSSLLAPNFSVDVGNFTNSGDSVDLQGTIVAGILDVRGSADIVGTLLMTFQPVAGQGPLYYGGSVSSFNTTIGYFSTQDGDGEGIPPDPGQGFGNITLKYDPTIGLPDGIKAPIKVVAVSGTYSEGVSQ